MGMPFLSLTLQTNYFPSNLGISSLSNMVFQETALQILKESRHVPRLLFPRHITFSPLTERPEIGAT